MKLVMNGKWQEIVCRKPHCKMPAVMLRYKIAKTNIETATYAKEKTRILLADMTLVREHFGANNSEALRLALHLTANAIRANTAKVTL